MLVLYIIIAFIVMVNAICVYCGFHFGDWLRRFSLVLLCITIISGIFYINYKSISNPNPDTQAQITISQQSKIPSDPLPLCCCIEHPNCKQ